MPNNMTLHIFCSCKEQIDAPHFHIIRDLNYASECNTTDYITYVKCPLTSINTEVAGIFAFVDFYYLELNVTYSIIKYKLIHLYSKRLTR